jgi:hypothetical protein
VRGGLALQVLEIAAQLGHRIPQSLMFGVTMTITKFTPAKKSDWATVAPPILRRSTAER